MILCLAAGSGYGAADDPDKSGTASGAVVKTEKPGALTPEQKKSLAHMLARYVLPVLLLLIIFVVILMVLTRAFRLWVLGRGRPVKFDPVDDLWSQAKDEHPRKEKKTGK